MTAPVKPKVKPSAGWIWVGVLVIVVGVVGAISLGIAGLVNASRAVDNFARFVVPDEVPQRLQVERAGKYTVYYESDSDVHGENVVGPDRVPLGLRISVTDSEGTELEVRRAEDDFSFSFNGRTGESVREVTFPEKGEYVVDASARGERFVLAIGKGSVIGRLVPYFVGAGASAFVGIVAGVLIIVIVGVKRSRRRRELRSQPPGAYGTPTGSPWYPTLPPTGPAPTTQGPIAAPPSPGGWAPPPPADGGWAPPPPPP
ncbi:MAG TPA: hypothetical protein VF855_02970 [Acidimicrobiales bacterium]